MQFKLFASLALASIVAASPARHNELANQCGGTLLCCDAVTSSSNRATRMLLFQLGINFDTDTTASVGLDCRINEASDPCKAQTVCCTDDSNDFLNQIRVYEGIVVLGCTPSNPNSCPN